MSDGEILERFQRDLDEIEKMVPMKGSHARVSPYIVEHDQFGHTLRVIVFHDESVAWYDNTKPDYSFMWLQQTGWMKPGDIVFDLGSNIGVNSVWYAKQTGPTGHVHAFDPFPWNALATRYNAELNGLRNVTAHSVGISNKASTLDLSISGARMVNYDPHDKFTATIKPITEFAYLKPTFMKIDIEGAEYEVSTASLSKFPELRAIYLELHGHFIRERNLDPATCIRNFARQGFDVRADQPYGPPFNDSKIENTGYHLYLTKKPGTRLSRFWNSLRGA